MKYTVKLSQTTIMEQAIFLVLDCTSVLVLKADAYSSLTVGSGDEIINNRQC